MKNHIKEAIYIIEQARKTMPECTNKAFLQGALNELNEALNHKENKEVKVFNTANNLLKSDIDNPYCEHEECSRYSTCGDFCSKHCNCCKAKS